MNAKPHRLNSDFQIRYFLLGDCKTADGGWTLLYGQKIDLENKLAASNAQSLRRQAKVARARAVLAAEEVTVGAHLEAEADIIEATADEEVWRINYEAAKQELATIISLMDKLEPHRKYKHLPLLEANEACQQEEWLLELQARAENYLITQGSIPPDQFSTMRLHPDFFEKIMPHITQITNALNKGSLNDAVSLLKQSHIPLLANNPAN